MEIISRNDARARGLTRYFTGKPCERGHIAERYVATPNCVECQKIHNDGQPRKQTRERDVRATAMALGNKRYFTGIPCKNGHVSERYVIGNGCVTCGNEQAQRTRNISPEKHRARSRKHYNSHIESERLRNNAAKAREYTTKRDEILERNRNWAHKNLPKLLTRNRRRRARELSAPGTFTATDWLALVARSPVCHWCRRSWTKKRRPTHDHVIPLSKGGGNAPENSVCACLGCNTSKNDRLINPITGQGILL